MDTRITARPALRLVGHATRVPLQHEGVNPAVAQHVESIPVPERLRLKELSTTEPSGLPQVSDDLEADYAEGSELTFMLGVVVETGADVPEGLDAIDVPAGDWAVFRTEGPHPSALQETWAATATDWFPSNPWRLRPAPRCWQCWRRRRT